MWLSRMVINGRSRARNGFVPTDAGAWLAVSVICLGVVATPIEAQASPAAGPTTTAVVSRSGPTAPAVAMCRPEPPDYPGCSPAQVRPLLRLRFAAEYTGHAWGYRYYRMGQHHRGVIFAHLPPAINAKLARLYHAAVVRYAAAHTSVVTTRDGVGRVVVSYPHFRTWGGFRANTTALCNGTLLTKHFPTQYCWALTKLGQAGAVVNGLLNRTRKIVFACNGFAIGGWASGSYAAWRMGTGVLAGGYYGGAAVEIGCQTTNLWNWATNLW